MKFAHEFKKALLREGFPPHWVESAVPYGQLKKCIKKVESELRSLGLDATTLAQLIPTSMEQETGRRRSRDGSVAFQYDFDGDRTFRPKLVLFVQLEDGLAVDAALSPATRQYLEKLVSKQGQEGISVKALDGINDARKEASEVKSEISSQGIPLVFEENTVGAGAADNDGPVIQRVEVPLTFDTEFFGLLQGDVTNLDTLQAGEQKAMTEEILALSNEITTLTKPSRFSKTDLYRWRELFDIYLQAGIFFSTQEVDHGSRSSGVALKKLEWFQSEVVKSGIINSFKLPASHQALERFVHINVTLLRNLKFQEINQLAITKILKKFDKRTKLGATKTFPKLIQSESIMTENMAKAVCSQVSQDLVKIVPQIDDYRCPICFTILWRPVELKCKHIFCSLCLVRMQRERERCCPLCRDGVVMLADEGNVMEERGNFIKKYFPKETREKQIELETAAGIEQFGIFYKHPSQRKCQVM